MSWIAKLLGRQKTKEEFPVQAVPTAAEPTKPQLPTAPSSNRVVPPANDEWVALQFRKDSMSGQIEVRDPDGSNREWEKDQSAWIDRHGQTRGNDRIRNKLNRLRRQLKDQGQRLYDYAEGRARDAQARIDGAIPESAPCACCQRTISASELRQAPTFGDRRSLFGSMQAPLAPMRCSGCGHWLCYACVGIAAAHQLSTGDIQGTSAGLHHRCGGYFEFRSP
jgi:hypothetical protein